MRSADNTIDSAAPHRAWADRAPLIFLLLYLTAHFAARLLMAPTLGIDDSEQALFAQDWAWGYRVRQPPLFTWLLLPVIEVTGVNILALSLLRYALIGLYFLFFHLTALRWIGDRRLAALASGSNLLIYVFAYYAHHDLTHTTLLATMIAMTFYVLSGLMERRALLDYALLGACFGLGLLAKWNFAFLIAAMTLALLLMGDWRGLVLTWKTALAAAVMTAVVAPTLIWIYARGEGFLALAERISAPRGAAAAAEPGALQSFLEGSAALAGALITFPQPFLVIFLLVFAGALRRALGKTPVATQDDEAHRRRSVLRFLGIYMLLAAAFYWLLVPVVGAATFKERWMHPVLVVLPIFLFAILERGKPSVRSMRLYVAVIVVVSLGVVGARAGRYLLGADHCGECRELAPFAALAEELRAVGFNGGTIVARGFHVGGNLRVAFPDSRVMEISYPPAVWPALDDGARRGQCLAAWRVREGEGGTMPEALANYLGAQLRLEAAPPAREGVAEAMMFGSQTKAFRLGYALFDPGTGSCR